MRGARGLLQRLGFFVSQVEAHAAMCVETSWAEFKEEAERATDLDALIARHGQHQQRMVAGLLLDRPGATALDSVRRVLRIALEFQATAARLQTHADGLFSRKLAAATRAKAAAAASSSRTSGGRGKYASYLDESLDGSSGGGSGLGRTNVIELHELRGHVASLLKRFAREVGIAVEALRARKDNEELAYLAQNCANVAKSG
eukprot:TRINITY_DN51450_c0_g1_i1.p1 TRINITY_DN51450_c0_g1~~TRINITY_DN51450_c0_g1_i1.p1  ORF type:complete len:216 (+),score=22.96 TRINITY_DN51450_c0_g1_i1:45-650(+)